MTSTVAPLAVHKLFLVTVISTTLGPLGCQAVDFWMSPLVPCGSHGPLIITDEARQSIVYRLAVLPSGQNMGPQ